MRWGKEPSMCGLCFVHASLLHGVKPKDYDLKPCQIVTNESRDERQSLASLGHTESSNSLVSAHNGWCTVTFSSTSSASPKSLESSLRSNSSPSSILDSFFSSKHKPPLSLAKRKKKKSDNPLPRKPEFLAGKETTMHRQAKMKQSRHNKRTRHTDASLTNRLIDQAATAYCKIPPKMTTPIPVGTVFT